MGENPVDKRFALMKGNTRSDCFAQLQSTERKEC